MPRLLIFLVGVGAGNTTRTLSWLAPLARMAPDLDVHIAAQGRALELLRDRCTVHPMRTVSYSSSGDLGLFSLVRSNLTFPLAFRDNMRRAGDLVRRLRPGVVVADSDFYCLGAARRSPARLFTVNSSPATAALLRRTRLPPECGLMGRIIEPVDEWLQHRYPERVLCPVLSQVRGLRGHVVQVPPVVRPECRPAVQPRADRVVVVTGGSGIGVDAMDLRGVRGPTVVFGARPARMNPRCEHRPFAFDVLEEMAHAKVLVVQGGFNSVSEAAVLGRPTVVVPIHGHAEQYVNARWMERLGLARMARGPGLGAVVNALLDDVEAGRWTPPARRPPARGAWMIARQLADALETTP